MAERVLMKGNEAFAEAAIRGGCRFYVGYPITPQSEIPEFMSHELPKRGGTFIQAESELGTINMSYGIGCAGGNVFISSASPGIALMQEGFSFLCSAEVPLVAMNVSRSGAGIGGIQPGQCDYNQVTRGGGNGDYHIPVFAPSTMQDAVDIIYESFEIADRYRNPVMILADGMMGQMMEPVVLPEPKTLYKDEADIANYKPWALTGSKGKANRNRIKSYHAHPAELEQYIDYLYEKYMRMEKELQRAESYHTDDAEIVFVAYGSMARIVREVLEVLRKDGIKAGMIRPISLWPFPTAPFEALNPEVTKVVISAEMSKGQMIPDIRLALKDRIPVKLFSRTGGIIPSTEEIVAFVKTLRKELK
ncbi:MAG: 3-methyl-2-oxobutanoate dehydrogenase subunit VorB [Chloroflexi bacterium]|nr:3-methyl-2-oxobutanoate dehydrogenase subunit VorB [Chloroflexota bacterium]